MRAPAYLLPLLALAASAQAESFPAPHLHGTTTARCLTDIKGTLDRLQREPTRAPPPARQTATVTPGRLATNAVVPSIELVDASCQSGNCPAAESQRYGSVIIYEVDTFAAASRFFRDHPDTSRDGWDEVIFFTSFVTTTVGGAYYAPISNEVSGIAKTYLSELRGETYNLNFQAGTGSKGFLKGTVLMGDWHTCRAERYVGVPCDNKPPYDGSQRGVLAILGQEVGHRWGSFLYFMDGTRKSDELLGRDMSHWSYYVDSGGSPLEGNRWLPSTRGGWELGPVTQVQFSPLDLYTMGALPPTEVPPTLVVRGVSPPPCTTDRQNPNVYMQCDTNASTAPAEGTSAIEGTPREVTIDEIIRSEGTRKPAFPDAPRIVHLAFALLELPTEKASATEQLMLDTLRRHFTRAFYVGTQSRVRAITTISRRDDLGLFDFTLDTEGWQPSASMLQRDGEVVFPTSTEATLTHTNLELDAAKETHLTLRVTTGRLTDAKLRIQWSNQESGDWSTLEVPAPATGRAANLVIPMAGRDGWSGTIRRMALTVVPVDAPATGELAIDRIDTQPPAVTDDYDGDFIIDSEDNCSAVANSNQLDTDADGKGDACTPKPVDPGSAGDGGCDCSSAALPGLALLAGLLMRRRARG